MKLNYILVNPRFKITLDLHEAEFYAAAVVVQPLIGNLVYYSNFGRYEPRLASSWERVNESTWVFTLKNGFVCENGEEINPKSFKQSIERSIKYLGMKEIVPVFQNLIGYNEFILGKVNDIPGIKIENNKLIFQFVIPVKSGLVQMLSFAPFGYICKDNLNSDGTWKDKTKFISSGPYKIKEIKIGEKYILKKRIEWPIKNNNSPEIVQITHEIPNSISENEHFILDSLNSLENTPNTLIKYDLVPEYINPILIGNLKNGVFSNLTKRKLFKELLELNRDTILPNKWNNHIRSHAFYPSLKNEKHHLLTSELINRLGSLPGEILIEGTIPEENTSKYYAWKVLEKTLNQLEWKFKFANNLIKREVLNDTNYDIRIRGSSIGAGVESWGLSVVFCSKIGPKFPDPEGKICKILNDYDNDLISDEELTNSFLNQVEEDAAIIPISHFGIQMYMTKNINQDSISPLISVMRFDDLVLE